MSHQPERKEKNCLNCGATVVGRYCHICGQENIETKESFWSLCKHFVYDIFHFDGKFFHTLKYIFVRPGLVAREYCLGKRNSFLHPIRMYLFTSAIFFLIFASLNHMNIGGGKEHSGQAMSKEDRMEALNDYKERLKQSPADTSLSKVIELLSDTTKQVSAEEIFAMDMRPIFTFSGRHYNSMKEYDSVQNSLPANEKDGRVSHFLHKKTISFNEKYSGRRDEGAKIFVESFLHRLPYMLFLSLPFFALILNLLYARRKIFYYSDHAIFTIYHYILSFIFLLIVFGVSALEDNTGWEFLSYIELLLFLAWPIYLLIEMKNFYLQRWLKTFGKFVLLNIFGLIVIFILFAGFLLFSVIEL